MRIKNAWVVGLLLASSAVFSLSGDGVATDNVRARLVSEVGSVAAGQSFWVALEFDIRDGWHTYWRNPGDSGLATKLTWTLPQGFRAGPIVWTVPQRFVLAPLINFGYAKHAVHLVEITAANSLAAHGTVTLKARANWLVCSTVCIPESADLQLILPTSAKPGTADGDSAALFAAARAELPQAAPASTSAQMLRDHLVITLGKAWGGTLDSVASLSFIPYEDGRINYSAPQAMSRGADSIELSLKPGYRPPSSGTMRGLLLVKENIDGRTRVVPLQIAARFAPTAAATATGGPFARIPPSAGASPLASLSPGKSAAPTLGLLLLSAILGGLVLNLMPCVFPVLWVKAIAVVEQTGKHPRAVRLKGLVFAAGVLGSMWALAAVLLALRAGGEQIGWGFQLQSPLFVTLMAYLLLLVGLNLSGVFEFGGRLAGVGDELTRGHGYRASFFTGLLTTLVATPCTAPFMAPAVGAALTQAPVVAFLIFTALGTGLALPYLLLCFAPGLRRALPRPGAWMETMKQAFAFPMYASAAWLLWVLAQQTSAVGLGAAFAGFVLVALAAWAYQKFSGGGRGRLIALAAAAAALLLAIALPVSLEVARTTAHDAPADSAANGGDLWQAYDPARAAELRAAGKPLLINFTASWCLTCLVNERNALADPAVQATFRHKGVTLMKGDWTNRDPRITAALAAFGRAGVPLYVVYNARPPSSEPLVLPQLLTPGIVRDAFAALPDREPK